MIIEGLVGWPEAINRRIGHPVSWIGALLSLLERHWNRPEGAPRTRKAFGILTVVAVLWLTIVVSWALSALLPDTPLGVAGEALAAASLLAGRSLHDHVAAVVRPLGIGDIAAARGAVGRIVGRDTSRMTGPDISRAALESLAENTSDGVIAPAFWGVLFGLPGIAAYKAINTLDSMIGHRTERYTDFGWCAARLDDLANLLPARLTGFLFALASGQRAGVALRIMNRDARRHRSPNAGWPESAMAGALDVRLSGPRQYDGRQSDEPWLNPSGRDPDADDLTRGLSLYRRVCLIGFSVIVGVAALELAL